MCVSVRVHGWYVYMRMCMRSYHWARKSYSPHTCLRSTIVVRLGGFIRADIVDIIESSNICLGDSWSDRRGS